MSTRKPLYQRTFLAILICVVIFILVEAVPHMVFGVSDDDPRPGLLRITLNILLWFVIVPLWFRLPNGGEPFRDYLTSIGLKSRFPVLSGILLGLLAYAILIVCIYALLGAFWRLTPDFYIPPQIGKWLGCLDSGIFEEICARGVILAMLLKRFKEWPAILISAAIFGLGHMARVLVGANINEAMTLQVIRTFSWGVMVAYMVVKTRSLVPGILYHILGNLITIDVTLAASSAEWVIRVICVGAPVAAALASMLVCKLTLPLLRKAGALTTNTLALSEYEKFLNKIERG